MKEYVEHIRGYPLAPAPEIFGLHENADITCDQGETYALLGTLLTLQPRVASGAAQGVACATDCYVHCTSLQLCIT